ncbi:MAG: hypothetical protein HC869_20535 [Rhodospirillales bacterium]|nr:hypothetical protein [Rhodospirillales bacterium]
MWQLIGLAVLGVIVLALASPSWLSPTRIAGVKPSIAVLPFDNLSDNAEQGYLADGFAEDIITALARNTELTVMARNTSFSFRGQRMRVEAIARERRSSLMCLRVRLAEPAMSCA